MFIYLFIVARKDVTNKRSKEYLARKKKLNLLVLNHFSSWHSCSNTFDTRNLKSKKISNDQELIQSDPMPCPQNQKGNNYIHILTAVYERHVR